MTGERKMRLIAAAALAAIVAAGTADAATLVVRSAGPSAKSLTPGRTLPDGAPVTLQAGDIITVLISTGTRILRGPGSFNLGGGGRGVPAAAFNPRARFGAMRSGEVESPTLWDVDVSQTGTFCLADPKTVTLWRPESDDAATLSLKRGAMAKTIAWPAGKATAAWPGGVPLAEGVDYDLAFAGSSDVSHLRLKTLATVPQDLPGLAKALLDNGCQSQLDLLVDTTPEAKP
jgi:hypothetical protein